MVNIYKKAQEEMVGFAIIIVIVAVIILVFLGVALNRPQTTTGVESYEVQSFISASLEHTTDCSTDFELSYDSVGDLITECDFEQTCHDGRMACGVLDSTLKDILESSWKTGEDRPVKGYVLNITSDDDSILSVSEGNITSNYKGNVQDLSRRGSLYSLEFKVYY